MLRINLHRAHVVRVTTFLFVPAFLSCLQTPAGDTWPQAAGPHHNWQSNGNPPLKWSATRNENIVWRTPLPEAGMSNVTIWKDRVFVTAHEAITSEEQKNAVQHVIGYCLDAGSGEVLWNVRLPGHVFISLAGGFTDGTVFAPITDGQYVWFFNRCGSIGCFDFDGNRIWMREWTPRFKHNNRQAEPFLVDNTILYVEVANKAEGQKIQKWSAPGKRSAGTGVPEGIDQREVWTYMHGIDSKTGKTLWRERVGTSIHNTPVVGMLPNGRPAVAHARGGPHGALERPYGQSLTRIDPRDGGTTLWSTEFSRYDPSFSSHWNHKYVFGFHSGHHVVMDVHDGRVLRRQQLYDSASCWRYDRKSETWNKTENVAVKAGKGHPNTNQANIVSGDWHWFLAHNFHYLGRVHIETGVVEYLELPAQLVASSESEKQNTLLWKTGSRNNRPTNANGFAVGDKGHNGTGWGHISAASPTQVGRYLFFPVVTGTVYVIHADAKELSPDAIVSINDLGPGEKTWTLASLTHAGDRLFAHTMKEIICIGNAADSP